MTEPSIRRAVMGDLGAVVALLEDSDDLHRRALPWLFRRVDGLPLSGFLEVYVSKADHAMFLAVAADGSLAGVLYMFLRPPARAPIVKPARVAEIDALVVASTQRRNRIGTRLVEVALRWANDQGAARTELGVYEFNESARAFWASVGFETLSRRLVLHSRSVKLVVHDRQRTVVAEVTADAALDIDATNQVVGTFVEGPGFGPVRLLLDRFNTIYASGDLEAASMAHADLDRLGMTAIRSDGVEYSVSVVYFQQGGLLFSVSRREE